MASLGFILCSKISVFFLAAQLDLQKLSKVLWIETEYIFGFPLEFWGNLGPPVTSNFKPCSLSQHRLIKKWLTVCHWDSQTLKIHPSIHPPPKIGEKFKKKSILSIYLIFFTSISFLWLWILILIFCLISISKCIFMVVIRVYCGVPWKKRMP